MNNKILLLLFLLSTNVCLAPADDIKSLYKQLDNAIQHSDDYVKQREDRIQTLKNAARTQKKAADRYKLYIGLYDEYKCYKNDSAVACLDRAIATATAMGRADLAARCIALQAFQCSTTGAYTEAIRLLNLIDRNVLDKKGLCDYYTAYNHAYGELGVYSSMKKQSQEFYKMADKYRDSLFLVLPENNETYLTKKEIQLTNDHKYAEAMKINDQRLKQCRPGTHEYGIVAYYRSLIYRNLKDHDNEKRWLITSAICDVRNAVMDQASLWILAHIIVNEGDVDRAYRYINFSWYAARTFGTKVRDWQISPVLGQIDNTYQKEIRTANMHLKVFALIVSMMALCLMFLLYYANKQKKNVTFARNELKNTNKQLAELNRQLKNTNDEIDSVNRKLEHSNRQLTVYNDKLNESNKVKDEYIGRFLRLCSMYIDKMDRFRMQVNRLTKNRQMDELLAITKDANLKEKDLDELYNNFDAAFLHLFPNFVNDLNALLKEEYRIALPEKGRLSTTARVFALIRLGVDDSTKIAEFLHYAVNTIYNYRAKLRNGAIGDRNDFEKKVKELSKVNDN